MSGHYDQIFYRTLFHQNPTTIRFDHIVKSLSAKKTSTGFCVFVISHKVFSAVNIGTSNGAAIAFNVHRILFNITSKTFQIFPVRFIFGN